VEGRMEAVQILL